MNLTIIYVYKKNMVQFILKTTKILVIENTFQ